MKYGRRIKNGYNGDVTWCELSEEEVATTLKENVRLNAAVLAQCVEYALDQKGLKNPDGEASLAANPGLRAEVTQTALALFAQCGVKAFVALQEALDEKCHWQKAHAIV